MSLMNTIIQRKQISFYRLSSISFIPAVFEVQSSNMCRTFEFIFQCRLTQIVIFVFKLQCTSSNLPPKSMSGSL